MTNRILAKILLSINFKAFPTLAAVVALDTSYYNTCANNHEDEDSVRRWRRLVVGDAILFIPSFTRTSCEGINIQLETEAQRFNRALVFYRSQISSFRRKWEYSAESSATTSTKIPSRSWPDNIPRDQDLSFLLEDMKYCNRNDEFNLAKGINYCNGLRFKVASYFLMHHDDIYQKRGLEMLKCLVEKEHSDAMVFYGMCLNDGRAGMEPNPTAAVSFFKLCSDIYHHPQSQYELGVAFYTGEGVTENEERAVQLFRLAAENNHPAACYMLGDCLLDGIGVDVDRASALQWLIRAAELGHRGARSRVMAVLEKRDGVDYGGFTDASRQTLLSDDTNSTAKYQSDNGHQKHELKRRQTIVGESRKMS